MNTAGFRNETGLQEETSIPLVPDEAVTEEPQAWEMIEKGRYMPRRIRGSFRGRVLG